MNREPTYSIAIVVENADAFPEMKRGLQPAFRVKLANNEQAIKSAVEDATLQAMIFDLDSVGEGASDGVEALEEIRAIRDDLVLVAMTRSRDHSIPLRASQAGADEFVLAPVNYEELQSLITRAIEKRALELEGRRVVQQAENVEHLLPDPRIGLERDGVQLAAQSFRWRADRPFQKVRLQVPVRLLADLDP